MKVPRFRRKTLGIAFSAAAVFGVIAIILEMSELAFQTRVIIYLAEIVAYLSFLFVLVDDTRERSQDIQAGIEGFAKILPLRQKELYPQLSKRLAAATEGVSITFLDRRSPLDDHDQERLKYYNQFAATAKARGIVVRRLDRGHPNVLPWINKIVETFRGDSNFSYAILEDAHHDMDSLDAVSVTIVDGRYTFLVAVGTQQEQFSYRDIEVESEDFAKIWGKYYDRLWAKAIPVVSRGHVDNAALSSLNQRLTPRAGKAPAKRK